MMLKGLFPQGLSGEVPFACGHFIRNPLG